MLWGQKGLFLEAFCLKKYFFFSMHSVFANFYTLKNSEFTQTRLGDKGHVFYFLGYKCVTEEFGFLLLTRVF